MVSRIARAFRLLLPSPLALAIHLTYVSFIIALVFTDSSFFSSIKRGEEVPLNKNIQDWALNLPDLAGEKLVQTYELGAYWFEGMWSPGYLAFEVQMMLMLVLGSTIAISKPVTNWINKLTMPITSTRQAAVWVCFFTLIASFINWGLGLVFGAIFARKVGEQFSQRKLPLNYPLIGAAAYCGLMLWHGGLSGSAPLKINETNHFLVDSIGVISLDKTIFSSMNLVLWLLIFISVPILFWLLGKNSKGKIPSLKSKKPQQIEREAPIGAEHIDEHPIFGYVFSIILVIVITYQLFFNTEIIDSIGQKVLSSINPNFVNLCLLALAVAMNKNFNGFASAVGESIKGISGILIQFPLYFGIMGIIRDSGLVTEISNGFVQLTMALNSAGVSAKTSFPILTMWSAGIVNFFVPSGGGQWTIQGPIILESAQKLGISTPKSIMALVYGDQLTNMLQPFWALPLLGITGLKAKEILPYTLILFLVGAILFMLVLSIF